MPTGGNEPGGVGFEGAGGGCLVDVLHQTPEKALSELTSTRGKPSGWNNLLDLDCTLGLVSTSERIVDV